MRCAGRDVVAVPLRPLQHPSAPPLVVATSHLESPVGTYAFPEREAQVAAGVRLLTELAQDTGTALQGRAQDAVGVVWGGVSSVHGVGRGALLLVRRVCTMQ